MSLRSGEAVSARAPERGGQGRAGERTRGSESAQLIEKARCVDEKSILLLMRRPLKLLRWAFDFVAPGFDFVAADFAFVAWSGG
jgi:hypothetical protein